jgi:MFS family permease
MPDKIGTVTSNTAVLSSVGLIIGPPFGGFLDKFGHYLVHTYGYAADLQFATPFIACSLVLVAPCILLWFARDIVEKAVAANEEEEEEDTSFRSELKRMASVFNRTTLTAVIVVIITQVYATHSCLITRVPLCSDCLPMHMTVCATQVMSNALFTILSPHLEPRCDSMKPLPGEHFPFAYSGAQIRYTSLREQITYLSPPRPL